VYIAFVCIAQLPRPIFLHKNQLKHFTKLYAMTGVMIF